MLKQLLEKQKEQLNSYFNLFDVAAAEQFLNSIYNSTANIYFTGIGKSGFVGRKIVATLQSTGTRAFFLCPTDALHGDLGIVKKEDIVVFLSKSGETEELVQLLSFIHNKKAESVALTSNLKSRLALLSKRAIYLPCEQELCPFDLAPTTSSAVQLLFGDVMAIALMQMRGFTREDYAENHPSGRIGKRLYAKVRDFMLSHEKVPTCFAKDSLEKIIVDFTGKRCGCMVIIDENRKLQGIFTDGDLRRALQEKGESVLKENMGNLMSLSPKSIHAEAFAWDALKVMEENPQSPVMVLPVLDHQKEVVGLIKMHDLIQAGL